MTFCFQIHKVKQIQIFFVNVFFTLATFCACGDLHIEKSDKLRIGLKPCWALGSHRNFHLWRVELGFRFPWFLLGWISFETGWWFEIFINIFYFHPYLGKWSKFDEYFSDGLKPPTRKFIWDVLLNSVMLMKIRVGAFRGDARVETARRDPDTGPESLWKPQTGGLVKPGSLTKLPWSSRNCWWKIIYFTQM